MGVLTGKDIELAWQAQLDTGIRAIEVYPARTLRAYQRIGVVSGTGKADEAKRSLIAKMKKSGRLRFDGGRARSTDNEHVLDSVLCALAATDFVEKRVIFLATDRERDLARKEGWIWIRDPARTD